MKWIAGLRSLLGHFWAILCLFIVLATFIGLGFWSRTFATTTGIKVSPWYSGGEVARTIDHGSYQVLLRHPVFDGLFSERSEGFVQIDWVPREKQSLPAVLSEELDLNGDGSVDAAVRIDTASNAAHLTPHQTWILGAENLITADQERILRIRLRNYKR